MNANAGALQPRPGEGLVGEGAPAGRWPGPGTPQGCRGRPAGCLLLGSLTGHIGHVSSEQQQSHVPVLKLCLPADAAPPNPATGLGTVCSFASSGGSRDWEGRHRSSGMQPLRLLPALSSTCRAPLCLFMA